MKINQFMWGYQHIFRHSVGFEVERALESIGASLEPEILLIGFAAETDCRHRVCIEPERGPLTQEHLDGVLERAAEIFEADPEARVFHSHRSHHERRQASLYRRARGRATCEAIEATGLYGNVSAFASGSTPVGGYEVHTIVLVDAAALDSLPSFAEDYFDRQYVGRSLQHEVIAECLRQSDRALYTPDAGAGLGVLGATTEELVGAAGRTFMRGCVVRSGQMLAGEPYGALCQVTSLSYERASATGQLLFLNPDHPGLVRVLSFERPVSLFSSRAVRKLLEMTDDSTGLICDGRDVFGLGTVVAEGSEGVYSVTVPAHATWQLNHQGNELMRVSYGQPSLPRPLLDRSQFADTLTRVIPGSDVDRLWGVVEDAAAAGHGATVVVSADAASEATRLGGQATPVRPTLLTAEDVRRIGRIDGALLLDSAGTCHAIGVILDGDARGFGDPARGSRFNSSVRYQMAAPAAAIVVVVSADGTIDLVPTLRPQVGRREVTDAVQRFVDIASADEIDGELFARSFAAVRDLGFYLDSTQCSTVNALYEAEQERRFASGGIRVIEAPLVPDPEMNDTYFAD